VFLKSSLYGLVISNAPLRGRRIEPIAVSALSARAVESFEAGSIRRATIIDGSESNLAAAAAYIIAAVATAAVLRDNQDKNSYCLIREYSPVGWSLPHSNVPQSIPLPSPSPAASDGLDPAVRPPARTPRGISAYHQRRLYKAREKDFFKLPSVLAIGAGRGGFCAASVSLWIAMPRTKAPAPMKIRKVDHAATN